MYLAVDIGGTKTLVACFSKYGEIIEQHRFLTPSDYHQFIRELAKIVASLSTKNFSAACIALPGRIDREKGIGIACGNLPWKNVHIAADIKRFLKCTVLVENDANLAGLSEALLLQDKYDRVLYITISTGIGTGIIHNQEIDPDFADTEGGHIILEHQGRRQVWERFASGSAIVRRFGKRAQDIHDVKTWRVIAKDISTGVMDLIAVVQPEVVVFGGGVSNYFKQFEPYVRENLMQFATPLTPLPALRKAQRPDEAVLFGCLHLAKTTYEKSRHKATV